MCFVFHSCLLHVYGDKNTTKIWRKQKQTCRFGYNKNYSLQCKANVQLESTAFVFVHLYSNVSSTNNCFSGRSCIVKTPSRFIYHIQEPLELHRFQKWERDSKCLGVLNVHYQLYTQAQTRCLGDSVYTAETLLSIDHMSLWILKYTSFLK